MIPIRWGPRTYAAVTKSLGGETPQASGNRTQTRRSDDREQRQNLADEAIKEGDRLRKAAAQKKAFFRMKVDLEGSRKRLGEGNIVSFLFNADGTGNISIDKKEINKVLRLGGFITSQVEGITINDYRSNQVEVLLKDEVKVDTLALENKLKAQGIDVIVSKFDQIEEFIMIYGLPLSNNMEYLENKIKEAIGPFVKNILDVTPGTHKEENGEDFFKGRYDGTWRVKVCPILHKQVPNYIVVDNKYQVGAKAVYTKQVGDKLEMCADCFSTEHYKRAPECGGPVKWSRYCDTFRAMWEEHSLDKEEQVEGDASHRTEEETRISKLNKTLVKDMESLEAENNRLKEEAHKNAGLTEDVKTLKEKLANIEKKNEALENELEDNKNIVNETHITMRKVASENGLGSPLRSNFELSFNNPEMEDKAFDESFDDTDKLPLSSQLTETVPGASALPPLPPRPHKRTHVGEGDSPVNKKTDLHPQNGDVIWMDSKSGKQHFSVDHKVNEDESDYLYILINETGVSDTYNLKEVNWGFGELEIDPDPNKTL